MTLIGIKMISCYHRRQEPRNLAIFLKKKYCPDWLLAFFPRFFRKSVRFSKFSSTPRVPRVIFLPLLMERSLPCDLHEAVVWVV